MNLYLKLLLVVFFCSSITAGADELASGKKSLSKSSVRTYDWSNNLCRRVMSPQDVLAYKYIGSSGECSTPQFSNLSAEKKAQVKAAYEKHDLELAGTIESLTAIEGKELKASKTSGLGVSLLTTTTLGYTVRSITYSKTDSKKCVMQVHLTGPTANDKSVVYELNTDGRRSDSYANLLSECLKEAKFKLQK